MNTAAAPLAGPESLGHRGGPLVMLLLLFAGWGVVRMLWWEDPFAPAAPAYAASVPPAGVAPRSLASPLLMAGVPLPEAAYDPVAAGVAYPAGAYPSGAYPNTAYGPPPPEGYAIVALPRPRPRLLAAYDPQPEIVLPGIPRFPTLPPGQPIRPEFLAGHYSAASAPIAVPGTRGALAAAAPAAPKKPRRWSLDAWAFNRQGSGAGPISQGLVPVYGASQAGAVLQYRLARSGRHDPRLYLRGTRALVTGESEAALGASIRPLGGVPVRVAGEARYTWFLTGSAVRPSAMAFTELPPVKMPLGTRLEAYGQAGYVWGTGGTYFADGQAVITRELPFVGRMSKDALRVSLGAGAWGGMQRGSERLDVGPSMRVDMKIGKMPARLSVDWRQRVAGDAAPGSGVAATITTGF